MERCVGWTPKYSRSSQYLVSAFVCTCRRKEAHGGASKHVKNAGTRLDATLRTASSPRHYSPQRDWLEMVLPESPPSRQLRSACEPIFFLLPRRLAAKENMIRSQDTKAEVAKLSLAPRVNTTPLGWSAVACSRPMLMLVLIWPSALQRSELT